MCWSSSRRIGEITEIPRVRSCSCRCVCECNHITSSCKWTSCRWCCCEGNGCSSRLPNTVTCVCVRNGYCNSSVAGNLDALSGLACRPRIGISSRWRNRYDITRTRLCTRCADSWCWSVRNVYRNWSGSTCTTVGICYSNCIRTCCCYCDGCGCSVRRPSVAASSARSEVYWPTCTERGRTTCSNGWGCRKRIDNHRDGCAHTFVVTSVCLAHIISVSTSSCCARNRRSGGVCSTRRLCIPTQRVAR